MEMREKGYYWIGIPGYRDLIPVYWCGTKWLLTPSQTYNDYDLRVIYPRKITSPDDLKALD